MRHEVITLPQTKVELETYLTDNRAVEAGRRKPLMLVFPGGAYAYRSDREAEPVALRLTSLGIQAVIVRYSVAPARYPKALEEAAEAVSENVPLELKPEIVYEDFDKIDFRVGTILSAEKHPDADKLLVFQVKMGTETRQIISGVAKSFTPEEMVGKKVVVVANLKPRKLRGMESKGMILFADNGERVEIVTTDAPDGEVVC